MVFEFDHLMSRQVSAHGVCIRSSKKQTGVCAWCLYLIIYKADRFLRIVFELDHLLSRQMSAHVVCFRSSNKQTGVCAWDLYSII
jgi:hypothetical protein